MADDNEDQGAESFDIEEQDKVEAPQMESFDDGNDDEYMDTNIKVPKFLDLNNPDSFSPGANKEQMNNQTDRYKASIHESQQLKKPYSPTTAIKQQKNVKSAMSMINQISGQAQVEGAGGTATGSAQQSAPVNIKKLKDAINSLEGLEYWVDPSKGDVTKLRKIAQPIINALKAYVKNLS